MSFEEWLRTVCFQKPTPEAYDLAKSAYNFAIDKAVKVAKEGHNYTPTSTAHNIAKRIKELKE